MSTRLLQKHALKGKRSFELIEDAVNVHIEMPFLDKEFTVVLSILDPEPVLKGSTLAFVSAVNREPLIELFVDRPDPESFKTFVAKVRQAAIDEDYGRQGADAPDMQVNAEQCRIAVDMLTTYLTGDEYAPLLDALQALKEAPEDRSKLEALLKAFSALGPMQGAVLTYAPYIGSLVSGDIPDVGPM